MVSYIRKAKDPGNYIIVVINFSGKDHQSYRIGVPEENKLKILLNSYCYRKNSSSDLCGDFIQSDKIASHNRQYSVSIDIPAYTILFIRKTE